MSVKGNPRERFRAYLLGLAVTGLFFAFVFAVLFTFAPVGQGYSYSFLYLEVFFLLPLSPLFVVWLYFLFKAIVPITGGMPGKGFKQWFYSYIFALSFLLYFVGMAFTLSVLFPKLDMYYAQMIIPSVTTAITFSIVVRIPRVNRFMWKVFGTDEERAKRGI